MNKYQEALYIITDWFHSYENEKGVIVHERHITPKYEKAKKTLQELVDKANKYDEKETPKKVRIETIFENNEELYEVYFCPNCGLILFSIPKYCSSCGQHLDNDFLDWSDEDDK